MVSSVNFGNFVTVGGKTIAVGSQSGIDTEALIKSLVEAKSIPQTRLTTQQEGITSKVSAIGSLRSLIATLQTSINSLRNPAGVDQAGNNSFEFRNVSMSTNDGSTAANYVTVTADPGTDVGSIVVEVSQIAAARQDRLLVGYASKTDDITDGDGITPGTFQINGENITIQAGDSLTSIMNRVNAKTADTGVKASIFQASSTDFRLVLTSTQTGVANDFTLTGADAVFGVGAFGTVQAAANALFEVNGVNLVRSSNTVSDVVEGVTLTLLQATPDAGLPTATQITATVTEDVETAFNQVLSFVAAYNEAKIFLAQQSERDEDGILLETAVLGDNSTVIGVERNLTSELNRLVDGLATDALDKLADAGITFTDLEADETAGTPATKNVLTVDQDELLTALQTNFDQVRSIFELQFTSDAEDKLGIFKSSNSLQITEFEVDIDTSRAVNDRVRITYTDPDTLAPVTINATLSGTAGSYKITGQDGTVIDGLEMVYVGDGTDVINVNVTQGIADRLYNYTDGLLEDDGLFDTEVDSLNSSSERLQTDIDRQTDIIESFRESLVTRFSALEEALAKVNSILQFLDAQSKANEQASA